MSDPAHKKIITTGRLAARLSTAEIATLKTNLTAHAPTAAFLKHGLELELGMGDGLALHQRALNRPDTPHLGAEIFLNGLEKLLRAQRKNPAPNLRILNEDARDLLARLPARSVTRLLLPFPDPWPKTRHHKRRLLQPELLNAAARVLPTGAEFWVITDWPSYAFHAITTFTQHPDFTLALTDSAAADCKPSARLEDQLGPHLLAQAPTWWVPTKYQQKAAKAGRIPWFICAIRR